MEKKILKEPHFVEEVLALFRSGMPKEQLLDELSNSFDTNIKTSTITTLMNMSRIEQMGSYKNSYANGREIMIRALLCGAASIVIVHNHPSGDCKPSKEDNLITEIIQKECKIVGMDFTDRIIIGEKGYYSFMEHEKEHHN